MAKTLTIGGENYLPQYKTNSAVITEQLQNKSGKMTLEVTVAPGQQLPQEEMEVIFKDGARFLFGGYISKVDPEEVGIGQLFTCHVEVSDYAYIFAKKNARRAYTNKTLKFIVEDLLAEYVDAAYGFTTTNVDTGPTLATITFDHISLQKCFEKLQKTTGYVWNVDYEKNLYFKPLTAEAAPEDIQDGVHNHEALLVAYDTSQVRNDVIVIGSDLGEQSESTITEEFISDGDTRAWELTEAPSEVVEITINGTPQQFSLDVNERDSDIFVYSFTGKSFRLTASQSVPSVSDSIEITYYPRVPIIVREIDEDSVDFFKAIEDDNGDGRRDHTIKDASIASKAEATARAKQELAEFAMPLVNGQFITRTSLLAPGSLYKPGQYVLVYSPVNNIDTLTAFTVQEVITRMVEAGTDGSETEYQYQVRFGGRLVGISEFLEGLASREGEITNADIIITLESLSEGVEISDDTPTHTIEEPPYKYKNGNTPIGKWNLSEWS